MYFRVLTLAFAFAAVSAAPPAAGDPLREGIALLEAGQAEQALPLLEAASERATDPGLVAFNRGVALLQLGRHREAELQFVRSLDDAAIPTERRAKALYNHGLCLLQRSDELAAIRAAIDCFASCREVASDVLLADAKHNLEVAKIRWLQLRAKQKDPPAPDDGSVDSKPSKPNDTMATSENGTSGSTANATVKPVPKSGTPGGGNAKSSPQLTPGAGTLPVLRDDVVLKSMTPEDAQSLLDETAKRLVRQRQSVESLRGGPDRPGVKDW